MENTLENKAQFIFQYFGQKRLLFTVNEDRDFRKVGFSTTQYIIENCHLELKSLSLITDEDAYNYAKNYLNWTDPDDYKKWFLDQGCQIKGHRHADFLRSKGYAVSFMGLSVEELENYGWIKLKPE